MDKGLGILAWCMRQTLVSIHADWHPANHVTIGEFNDRMAFMCRESFLHPKLRSNQSLMGYWTI